MMLSTCSMKCAQGLHFFFSFFLSDLLADFAQPQLCLAYSSSEFSIDIETSSIGSVQLMRHNVLVLDIHFFTNSSAGPLLSVGYFFTICCQ